MAVCAGLAVLAGAGPAAAVGPLGGTGVPITVRPISGTPRTIFVVSFRAPQRSGLVGGSERRCVLSASGPQTNRGCLANAGTELSSSSVHARVTKALDPSRLGGHWCVGTFKGEIDELEQPVCKAGQACLEYVLLLGSVGRFRFDVRASRAAEH